MVQSITKNLIINSQQSVDCGRNAYGSNAPEPTVYGLLCVNFMYKSKKCLGCRNVFKPTSGNQFYCGSRKLKIGCVWKNIKNSYLKRNPIKQKEYWSKKWINFKTNRQHKTCTDCKDFIEENDFRKKLCKKCKIKHNKNKGIRKRFLILAKYNFTCIYCGRKAPDVELHVDHLVPKSKNGSNKKENFVVACKDCNQGKSDLILSEIIQNPPLQSSVRFCL